MSKPAIKLMADYGCWPIWHYGGKEVGNIDPCALGLSPELLSKLGTWVEVFESHLDRSDPAATSWSTKEEADFDDEGRRLCRQLALEVGQQFSVFYFDSQSGSCVPAETLWAEELKRSSRST